MKALSIRQPWASLILAGHKTVENRVWNTGYRGPIIVHAGVTIAQHAVARAATFGVIDPPIGAYLGVVDLAGVHHVDAGCSCDPTFAEMGVYHWQLLTPLTFDKPIAGPGRLALYEAPDDVGLAAVDLITEAVVWSEP